MVGELDNGIVGQALFAGCGSPHHPCARAVRTKGHQKVMREKAFGSQKWSSAGVDTVELACLCLTPGAG